MALTLRQAQERYIDRRLAAHPGHARRVARSAWNELHAWATKRGMDAAAVCREAREVFDERTTCED